MYDYNELYRRQRQMRLAKLLAKHHQQEYSNLGIKQIQKIIFDKLESDRVRATPDRDCDVSTGGVGKHLEKPSNNDRGLHSEIFFVFLKKHEVERRKDGG